MLWLDAVLMDFMGIRMTMDATGWGVMNGELGWISMTGPVCVLISGIVMVLIVVVTFLLPRIATGADEIIELISKGARVIPFLALFGVIYFYFDAKSFQGCATIPDEWIGYAVWVAGPFAVLGAIFGITLPRVRPTGVGPDRMAGLAIDGQRVAPRRSYRREMIERRMAETAEGGSTADSTVHNPELAREHFMKAAEYKSRKEYQQAISAYGEAIDADPNYALAFFNRASLYVLQGQTDEALNDFRKVMEISEDPDLSGMAQRRINDLSQPL